MNHLADISRIPLASLMAVYRKHSGDMGACTKAAAAEWVCRNLIDHGRMTVDEVRNTPPIPMQVTVPTGVDPAELASIKSVADQANATALTLGSDLAALRTHSQDQFAKVAVALSDLRDRTKKDAKQLAQQLADISTKLDTVDHDKVQAEVAAAIAAAFAPFKEAVDQAGAADIVGAMVAVRKIESKPAQEVFGVPVLDIKGKDLMVDLYNDPDAPAIDPDFIWSADVLRYLMLAQNTGDNLWFGGEKGTGKTQTAQQFAARTGRSFTRLNFQKYTTAEDHVGATALEGGATVYKEGDFLNAYSRPGSVILMDEVTNADPACLAVYNGLLEPNAACNVGGKVRRRAAGVLVFAADNTLTNGDESGRYAGTRTMNSALADRFAQVIHFVHMPAAQEIAAVVKRTGCKYDLAKAVVDVIAACRAKVKTGDIVDAPSIRQAIALIRAIPIVGVDAAWNSAIANRQPSESAAALEALRQATFNSTAIAKLV